ncbi:MAG: hypothetical protein ACRD3Q_20415 [Terriglobales bacterium]
MPIHRITGLVCSVLVVASLAYAGASFVGALVVSGVQSLTVAVTR